MFASKFALALFTAAASASEQYHYGGYNSGYGGYRGQYGQPQYGQAPAQPHSNPWATPGKPQQPAVDKSGWYSPYQQYSKPWRQYVPIYSPRPIMAVCALESGNVQLAQLSGQASMVNASLSGLTADTGYLLRVREWGNMGNECADGGDEFNPLKELKYGVSNPHQDMTRGRIQDATSDASGEVSIFQKVFLQNLSGKESLIGKSITLMQVVPDGDNIAVDCCVIGEDALPDHMDLSVKENKTAYQKYARPAPPAPPAPRYHQYSAPAPSYQPYYAQPTYSGYSGYNDLSAQASKKLAEAKQQQAKLPPAPTFGTYKDEYGLEHKIQIQYQTYQPKVQARKEDEDDD